VAADAYRVAQLKAGLHIGHRFVMAAGNLPAGDQVARFAGLPRFEADHHGPNIGVAEADLHRQIGDVGRTGNRL